MSREHVEAVDAIAARWNAGRTVPTEYFDPEVELETPISSVSGQPFRGYRGIGQFARETEEQFSLWKLRLDDVRAVGSAVIATGSARGRGRPAVSSSISPPRSSRTSEWTIGLHAHGYMLTWTPRVKPSGWTGSSEFRRGMLRRHLPGHRDRTWPGQNESLL